MDSPKEPSNTPTPQDIDGLLQVLKVPLDAAQAIPKLIGRPVQLLASDRGPFLKELAPALVQPAGCVHRLLHLAAGRGTGDAAGSRRASRPLLRPQMRGGCGSEDLHIPLRTSLIRPPGDPARAPPDRLARCGPHPGTGWQGPEHPLPSPITVTHPRTTKNGSSRDMSPPPRRRLSPLPSLPCQQVSSQLWRTGHHPHPRHVTRITIETRITRRERETSEAGSEGLPPPPRPSCSWAETAL